MRQNPSLDGPLKATRRLPGWSVEAGRVSGQLTYALKLPALFAAAAIALAVGGRAAALRYS